MFELFVLALVSFTAVWSWRRELENIDYNRLWPFQVIDELLHTFAKDTVSMALGFPQAPRVKIVYSCYLSYVCLISVWFIWYLSKGGCGRGAVG